MNHEQKTATQAMLRLYNAIVELQQAAIQVKALHWQVVTGYQREVVENCYHFAYADNPPTPKHVGGDGLFFNYDKFVMLVNPESYKPK